MKRNILPKFRNRPEFKKVAFAIVNPDTDNSTSRQLIGSGPIPQIRYYRKTSRGWIKKTLVGVQEVDRLEELVNQNDASKPDKS